MRYPKHVAIIMDGNGRWARNQGLPRIKGHEKGAETVREIITETRKKEIPFLTLYTFSTENWGREKLEVDFLMNLLCQFLESEKQLMLDKDIRFKVSGDLSKLPKHAYEKVVHTLEATAHCKSMVLNLALSYGSRQEIIRAIQKIEDIDSLTQEEFSKHLYTHDMPDPDLMIRTGGEKRISNFLLWQLAYTELYFIDTFWPDFTVAEYNAALNNFSERERRYGLVK